VVALPAWPHMYVGDVVEHGCPQIPQLGLTEFAVRTGIPKLPHYILQPRKQLSVRGLFRISTKNLHDLLGFVPDVKAVDDVLPPL